MTAPKVYGKPYRNFGDQPRPDDLVGVVMRRWERDKLRELAFERGVTVPALLRQVLAVSDT